MANSLLLAALAALLLLSGCRQSPEAARAIGEAFAGPASLNLRKEIVPRSPVTATIKHGERVEVLQTRRRFVKVRTAQGVEGWTDSRQLLAANQMRDLRRLAERASRMPGQGAATVHDVLNVHTEPNRQSPSFHQIGEKDTVEVLDHRLAPRVPYQAPAAAFVEPRPVKKKTGKKKDEEIPPPPMPAPPGPPDNWLELSGNPAGQPVPAPAPGRMDDWSLVRLRDGRAGWVLTRMLVMGIPDEVAQYAEGHRITSYFALGEVQDGEVIKKNWLWTTLADTLQPYHFDSFRVFVWSKRRHRYETAYIERRLVGYYPVTVDREGEGSFSLIVQNKEGALERRTYGFSGYRVALRKKEPWSLTEEPQAAEAPAPPPSAPQRQPGLLTRLKQKFNAFLGR